MEACSLTFVGDSQGSDIAREEKTHRSGVERQ